MDSPVRTDPSYRFGLFEVFPETGRLFRQGQRVKLQEQPFKLLLLLIEKPGEIVPRFTPENREANQAFVDLVGKFAQRNKATPAQIALAWVLAQKPWFVPIPGTTKLHRLEENLAAANVELSSNDLRELNTAASKIAAHGARYQKSSKKWSAAEQQKPNEKAPDNLHGA